MKTADFMTWLGTRTDRDWRLIEAKAKRAAVGSWRWEQAWEAAAGAHEVAAAAMQLAQNSGAGQLAAAAVAGAMAALELEARLDPDDSALLCAPLAGLYPPRTDPPPESRRKPELLQVAIVS